MPCSAVPNFISLAWSYYNFNIVLAQKLPEVVENYHSAIPFEACPLFTINIVAVLKGLVYLNNPCREQLLGSAALRLRLTQTGQDWSFLPTLNTRYSGWIWKNCREASKALLVYVDLLAEIFVPNSAGEQWISLASFCHALSVTVPSSCSAVDTSQRSAGNYLQYYLNLFTIKCF